MSTAPSQPRSERIIIVMGVSSSGKSTVGDAVGKRLAMPFLDGDRYHPDANVEKMRAGIPLTDEDRWPWLERLAVALRRAADQSGMAIGACSALRRVYRDFLVEKAGEPILFVYLQGSKDVIAARIAARQHEFMPASLLDSQFATLEEPSNDEDALVVPVTETVPTMVRRVLATLGR